MVISALQLVAVKYVAAIATEKYRGALTIGRPHERTGTKSGAHDLEPPLEAKPMTMINKIRIRTTPKPLLM
jgi:hypothetical protein